MDRYTETFETWNKVASLYQDRFMDLDLCNDTYSETHIILTAKKKSTT